MGQLSPVASVAPNDNRRRSTRVIVHLSARSRAVSANKTKRFAGGTVVDLSLDGARVAGLAGCEAGSTVDLDIDLGSVGSVRTSGRVIRSGELAGRDTTAVAFSHIATRDLVKLAEYLWG